MREDGLGLGRGRRSWETSRWVGSSKKWKKACHCGKKKRKLISARIKLTMERWKERRDAYSCVDDVAFAPEIAQRLQARW
jgi:hypothetical protein